MCYNCVFSAIENCLQRSFSEIVSRDGTPIAGVAGVEKIWSGMSLSRGGKLVRLTVAIRVVTLQG